VRHVYIYYRIDPAQADAAAHAVDALLTQLTPYCAIPPRRLVRCDEPELWMEVYEGIADWAAFETALQVAEAGLTQVGIPFDSRHCECFCPPLPG